MTTDGKTILTSVMNGLQPLSSTASQMFPYQSKPSQQGWRLWNKLISKLKHTGTLTLKQPLRPWYYTGEHLHWKWTAMIDPSSYTLYIKKTSQHRGTSPQPLNVSILPSVIITIHHACLITPSLQSLTSQPIPTESFHSAH